MQVVDELRRGVRLKKINFTHHMPTEYEMTPYEILMDDIRSRWDVDRYGIQLFCSIFTLKNSAIRSASFDFIAHILFSRRRKYNLRKVMVNGDIPRRVKKDAHAVILEFIRSRPPLRKVSTLHVIFLSLFPMSVRVFLLCLSPPPQHLPLHESGNLPVLIVGLTVLLMLLREHT